MIKVRTISGAKGSMLAASSELGNATDATANEEEEHAIEAGSGADSGTNGTALSAKAEIFAPRADNLANRPVSAALKRDDEYALAEDPKRRFTSSVITFSGASAMCLQMVSPPSG